MLKRELAGSLRTLKHAAEGGINLKSYMWTSLFLAVLCVPFFKIRDII